MTKDMTTGSSLKIILLFSIPVLLGNLFQQFYNMVDTIIVGRYLGEDALAAVGSTGCIMFLVLGFATGIAQGFGVMIPTVAASRLFLVWMHTPDNILSMADAYIKVIFAGIILTMLYNVSAGILRGIGDSKTPLYFLIFSSILNVVLDLLFIIVLKAGTAGAAYATIIAQGISAILCFIHMFRQFEILRTTKADYYLDRPGVINMLSIGITMALNYSITAIGTMILQSAVNVFGSSVVASFTAASKVNNIATQTMPTLGTAMATYCGQNLGAGKYDRIFDGMRKGFFICIAAAAIGAAICIFGGEFIVSWFVSNPSDEIFSYAMMYLKTVSWFFLPLAMIFLYRNALQGLGEGLVPMLSGVIELVCRFVAIALLQKPLGYQGICLADPAAWVGAGIPLMITYIIWKSKKIRQHSSSPA